MGRAVVAASVLVGAALHVSVTGQVVVPVLALLVALAGVVGGARFSMGQAAQALLLVGSALFAFALVLVDPPTVAADGGPKLQYVVASCAALLTVAARLWMRAPERGHAATWAIGLVVFYACGRVAAPVYLPLAVVFLGLAWVHQAVLSTAGRHRSARHVGGAIAMICGAAVLAGGAAMALRVAYQGANAFVLSRVVGGEVGFGAGAFELGSMDGMRSSDEVILRVHGPAGEHFRGQVYREYAGGTWLPPGGRASAAPTGGAPSGELTIIEFVSSKEERLFLPDGSGAVDVRPAGLLVDAMGVPRPSGEPPEEVRLDTTSAARFPPAAPVPADLDVPPEVGRAIAPLIAGWVAGAETPADRVQAIRKSLEQNYTYSLHYERDAERDPVVQFMLDSRLGHCEYFAAAMVLSARQAGVPARVVTGFRSTEVSPFGGHRIVRSRDAHAWAEVHVDGAWVLVDPSPQNSVEAGPARAFLAGALDDLALAWDRVGPQVVLAILLIVFVGLQIRTLLRNRKKPPPVATEAWVEGPPGWLLPLLNTLAEGGLVRHDAEPVEAFAARVEGQGEDEAGALLGRYAALRYGGKGDEDGLARAVAGWSGAPRG